MAIAVDGVIVGWGEASHRFWSTDVTVPNVAIRLNDGGMISFAQLDMQLDVARVVFSGARGRFYLSSGKKPAPLLYGVRYPDGEQVFKANDGFDAWMVALFYLILGIAFCWTIIGIFVALLGWRLIRQIKDAGIARAVFDSDISVA